MNDQATPRSPWYAGIRRESTAGTVVQQSSEILQRGLGMTPPYNPAVQPLFPAPHTATEEHQHRYCFAISDRGALRGCETCGKAWILGYQNVGNAWCSVWRAIGEFEG